MSRRLTEEDARVSLKEHAESRGHLVWSTYGPRIGWDRLMEILEDRLVVRYPCTIEFATAHLEPGELAWPSPNSEDPGDGFTIYVHEGLSDRRNLVPAVVLYQLVAVNYGAFVSERDAEAFGAAALGMDGEDYYEMLCVIAGDLGV